MSEGVCDITFEKRKRFMEISCDEVKDKDLVSMFKGINTIEQDIELINIFDQAPDNPCILRMFDMFREGNFSKGIELY